MKKKVCWHIEGFMSLNKRIPREVWFAHGRMESRVHLESYFEKRNLPVTIKVRISFNSTTSTWFTHVKMVVHRLR